MRIFQGCIAGREIAMTRAGANPHTVVLVQKSKTSPATADPETTTMNAAEVAKAANAILSMSEVTKAHYLGLTPEVQAIFLEKTPDEMRIEAEAAKSATDAAAAATAAAAAGLTQRDVAQSALITGLTTEVETLKSRLADADVEKRASGEFSGFPGGAVKAVELLKSFAKLPQAERETAEGLMRSQCELAKRAGASLGYSEDDVAKAMPATAELNLKAAEVAKAKNIPVAQAIGEVMADEANADLFARVRAEQAEAATRH